MKGGAVAWVSARRSPGVPRGCHANHRRVTAAGFAVQSMSGGRGEAMRRTSVGLQRSGTVGIVAATLAIAGCSSEPPQEISAIFQVHASLGQPNAEAWAAIAGKELATFADEVILEVDGTERPLQPISAKTLTSLSDTPRRAAGESYEFALDAPWRNPAALSLPMPAAADLETPADGDTIHVQDGLTVTWSGGATDAGEAVRVRLPGAFSTLDVGFVGGVQFDGVLGTVAANEDGIHIPFDELREWFAELDDCLAAAECIEPGRTPGPLRFPIEVEVSVWRTTSIEDLPGFAASGSLAGVALDLGRMTVTLAE